jgi:hypothetical protein
MELADLDTNEANNSFDPTQFFNSLYALDAVHMAQLARKGCGPVETEVADLKVKLVPISNA